MSPCSQPRGRRGRNVPGTFSFAGAESRHATQSRVLAELKLRSSLSRGVFSACGCSPPSYPRRPALGGVVVNQVGRMIPGAWLGVGRVAARLQERRRGVIRLPQSCEFLLSSVIWKERRMRRLRSSCSGHWGKSSRLLVAGHGVLRSRLMQRGMAASAAFLVTALFQGPFCSGNRPNGTSQSNRPVRRSSFGPVRLLRTRVGFRTTATSTSARVNSQPKTD